MKILQLDIEGFRSLKKVSWQPGDLNVIIGPNGSGKSNLLRFMELLAQSARGALGEFIQSAGGMGAVTWDGQANSISLKVRVSAIDESLFPSQQELIYGFDLSRLGQSSSYRVQQEALIELYKREQAESLKLLERLQLSGRVIDKEQHSIAFTEDSLKKEEESLLSMVRGPFVNNTLIKLFQASLSKFKIYHDVPVDQNAKIRQPIVVRIENVVNPDGQNLIAVLHNLYEGKPEFRKAIDAAMLAAFGSDYDELIFLPAADQRIQLKVRWKTLREDQSTANLSDGTLRFLFLLTALSQPWPLVPLIAIDEPENGLHPSMFPIIAEYAVEASKRSQIIFTTHSPQFLDAFTDTKPTTTVAKWENGETQLNTIAGSELDYWLKEYTLGELFRSRELEAMG